MVFSRCAADVDMVAMSGMEIVALQMLTGRRVMIFAMAPETCYGMPWVVVSALHPRTGRIECPYQMARRVVSAKGLFRSISLCTRECH